MSTGCSSPLSSFLSLLAALNPILSAPFTENVLDGLSEDLLGKMGRGQNNINPKPNPYIFGE